MSTLLKAPTACSLSPRTRSARYLRGSRASQPENQAPVAFFGGEGHGRGVAENVAPADVFREDYVDFRASMSQQSNCYRSPVQGHAVLQSTQTHMLQPA